MRMRISSSGALGSIDALSFGFVEGNAQFGFSRLYWSEFIAFDMKVEGGSPKLDSTVISPPSSWMKLQAMERPRLVPSEKRRPVSVLVKRLNSFGISSSVIPHPVSQTSISMRTLRLTWRSTSVGQETAIAFDRETVGFLCRELDRVADEVDQELAQVIAISRQNPDSRLIERTTDAPCSSMMIRPVVVPAEL